LQAVSKLNSIEDGSHDPRVEALVRIAGLLLDGGADVRAKDKAGRSVAFYALECGGFLDRIYSQSPGHGAPLMDRLLAGVAATDVQHTVLGATLLHAASEGGERALVQRFSSSISPRERTLDGRTPLHFAGTAEAVTELASRGADVNATDRESRTPLHYAAMRMRGEAAMALVKAGAKTEAPDSYGRTPSQYNADYLLPTEEQLFLRARAAKASKASKGARKG
jgi:hypothetical protein